MVCEHEKFQTTCPAKKDQPLPINHLQQTMNWPWASPVAKARSCSTGMAPPTLTSRSSAPHDLQQDDKARAGSNKLVFLFRPLRLGLVAFGGMGFFGGAGEVEG